MKLEYSEFYDKYILVFTDNDRCNYCNNVSKCPLVKAVEEGSYVISSRRDGEVPSNEFCDMFEANERIKNMEKSLKKKGKAKDE